MRLILFFIGGILFANIAAATFWYPSNEPSSEREPIVNSVTPQGQDRWMELEPVFAGSRANIRRGVLEALSMPWAAFCTPDGHKTLIEAINNYYYQRDAETWSKADAFGEQGKRFAIKAWTTSDDSRIERLSSEFSDRGYFSVDELKPYARTPLTALTKRGVRAKPCAS